MRLVSGGTSRFLRMSKLAKAAKLAMMSSNKRLVFPHKNSEVGQDVEVGHVFVKTVDRDAGFCFVDQS